jgi:methionyl-tRNA formyltransferase
MSAIRWAYRRQEPITAATWFCANERLDAGDICEQEIIKIDYSLSPRAFYERDILPAMVRTLERALKSISSGHQRKIPQIEQSSKNSNFSNTRTRFASAHTVRCKRWN